MTRTRLRPALALCLASSLILVAGGCQKASEAAAERMMEKALGVEVEKDGNQVVFKGKEGDLSVTSGEGTALPKNFPADVPLPEDAKVESVMEFGGTQIVTLSVPGTLESAIEDASERMVAQGWEQGMRAVTGGESGMLAYSKKADDQERSASLMFSSDEGKVQLVVSVKDARGN